MPQHEGFELNTQDVVDYSFIMDGFDDCLEDDLDDTFQARRNGLDSPTFNDGDNRKSRACSTPEVIRIESLISVAIHHDNAADCSRTMATTGLDRTSLLESPLPKASRRVGVKKQKGMPKRPLSAYNIFFRTERRRLIEEQHQHIKGRSTKGKISFEELGKRIGKSWQQLTAEQKQPYVHLSTIDVARYQKEMVAVEREKNQKKTKKQVNHAVEKDFMSIEHQSEYRNRFSTSNDNDSVYTDVPPTKTVNNNLRKSYPADIICPTLDDGNMVGGNQKHQPYGSTPLQIDSDVVYCSDDFSSTGGGSTNRNFHGSLESTGRNAVPRNQTTMGQSGSDSNMRSVPPSHRSIGTVKQSLRVLYGPPSFEWDVHRVLPLGAIECEKNSLPVERIGISEVAVTDSSGIKQAYNLEYRCFRMSKCDAEDYLQSLHFLRHQCNQNNERFHHRHDEVDNRRHRNPIGFRHVMGPEDFDGSDRYQNTLPSMSLDYRHSSSIGPRLAYPDTGLM